MLGEVEQHEGIIYVNATGEQIPLARNLVDIVTITGSLNYIDQAMLVSELKRICRTDAKIVVYDFEIDLSTVEALLELEPVSSLSEYDHRANLRGHFEVKKAPVIEDVLMLDLNSLEVTHLLLSQKARYEALQEKYQTPELFNSVRNEIDTSGPVLSVKANIYYSVYALR